jgi:hypothetical protein
MAARPLTTRVPNERLQQLVREAAVSNSGLARQVNAVGARYGLDLRYDKTSVSRWLRGQRPRGQVSDIIGEVLGRRLGRTLSAEDVGLGGACGGPGWVGLRFAGSLADAVEQACHFWHMDAVSQSPSQRSGTVGSALVEASRDWLIAGADPIVARAQGQWVGMADVGALKEVTRALAELDHRLGSRRVRPVVVSYLDSVLAALINGRYRDDTGRQLFGAAARLTELAGYMALDAGEFGMAQRCYVQALRLAQAADERGYGGYVLAAGMSRLSATAGRAMEAVQLARVAQEGAEGHAPQRARAMFYMAEARGYALLGEGQRCDATMERAVEAFESSETEDMPEWIAHYDRGYLADELAHCHRDLHRPGPATRQAKEALAVHPHTRVRRRTIDLLLLASVQIQGHDMLQAHGTVEQAVALLGGLQSALAYTYLREVGSALRMSGDRAALQQFEALVRNSALHRVDLGWNGGPAAYRVGGGSAPWPL